MTNRANGELGWRNDSNEVAPDHRERGHTTVRQGAERPANNRTDTAHDGWKKFSRQAAKAPRKFQWLKLLYILLETQIVILSD